MFAILLYRDRQLLCPSLKEQSNPIQFLFWHDEEWAAKESSDKAKEYEATKPEKQSEDSEVDKEASIRAREKLDVLVGQYEPRAFWFEVMECVRRLALSSLLILINDGSAAQAVLAVFICLLSIIIYSYFTPYAQRDDDILTEVTQWQLFFAFFAALMIRVDTREDRYRERMIFGAVLISVSCVSFVVLAVQCGFLLKKFGRRVRIFRKSEVDENKSRYGRDIKETVVAHKEREGGGDEEEGEEASIDTKQDKSSVV